MKYQSQTGKKIQIRHQEMDIDRQEKSDRSKCRSFFFQMKYEVTVHAPIESSGKQEYIYLSGGEWIHKNIHDAQDDRADSVWRDIGMKMEKTAERIAVKNHLIEDESLIDENGEILKGKIRKAKNKYCQ